VGVWTYGKNGDGLSNRGAYEHRDNGDGLSDPEYILGIPRVDRHHVILSYNENALSIICSSWFPCTLVKVS